MISHKQRLPLLKPRFRNASANSAESPESTRIPEGRYQDEFENLQRSQEQLRTQAANLLAQNKELEEYAHMVAHDLKDPLTVLVVTSDLIAEIPDLTSKELKDYLQQIRSSVYAMNRIIDNLLLFAEVDKAEAPVEPVDMARVVTNVQYRLSPMVNKHKAQIGLPSAWPEAMGYASWIEEVWANYISNAIKHGGRQPWVELGASKQPDGMIKFWTRDNGPGLAPDAYAHLFTPFSQIDRIHNPGRGLGLSIVLQIVEKLGGQVGVESEPGQGSLFYFSLPAGPASQQQNQISPPTNQA
jgi:two-component system, sensor histidine kinase and response regulator